MNFNDLVSLVGNQPWFDLPTLTQLISQRRGTLLVQLSRWVKSGKVMALRRGLYALPAMYRRKPVNPAALANVLFHPSYLSSLWALSYYGIIPEATVEYTSVTTRTTRRFDNEAGRFSYSHLKPDFFFGFQSQQIDNCRVMIADPEKALLDHWHLATGEWTPDRMAQMRYQNFGAIGNGKLAKMAGRFRSPRLLRAVTAWKSFTVSEQEGTQTL